MQDSVNVCIQFLHDVRLFARLGSAGIMFRQWMTVMKLVLLPCSYSPQSLARVWSGNTSWLISFQLPLDM